MSEKYIKETNASKVLEKDGVNKIDTASCNMIHLKSNDYMNKLSESWAKKVIYNEQMSAHLICQLPGETNRTHFHESDDEWWIVLKGKIKWWIEGIGEIEANQGDIVFVPRKKQHKIKTIGDDYSIRIAICKPDIEHKHPIIDNAPEKF